LVLNRIQSFLNMSENGVVDAHTFRKHLTRSAIVNIFLAGQLVQLCLVHFVNVLVVRIENSWLNTIRHIEFSANACAK
jgi:predicted ester cyclase